MHCCCPRCIERHQGREEFIIVSPDSMGRHELLDGFTHHPPTTTLESFLPPSQEEILHP